MPIASNLKVRCLKMRKPKETRGKPIVFGGNLWPWLQISSNIIQRHSTTKLHLETS